MTDYWLSKMIYDMQRQPALAAEYRNDMDGVLDQYSIAPDVRTALQNDDVATLAPRVNAYLLRFYFQIRRMPEQEFVSRLHALKQQEAANG